MLLGSARGCPGSNIMCPGSDITCFSDLHQPCVAGNVLLSRLWSSLSSQDGRGVGDSAGQVSVRAETQRQFRIACETCESHETRAKLPLALSHTGVAPKLSDTGSTAYLTCTIRQRDYHITCPICVWHEFPSALVSTHIGHISDMYHIPHIYHLSHHR